MVSRDTDRFGFLFLVKKMAGLCARMAPGCSNDQVFTKVTCKVEVGLEYGGQQP